MAQTAVAGKLTQSLKNKIISAYSKFVIKAQRGHPLENYENIIDAMSVIDYITDFEVDDYTQIKSLEHYIIKLSHG